MVLLCLIISGQFCASQSIISQLHACPCALLCRDRKPVDHHLVCQTPLLASFLGGWEEGWSYYLLLDSVLEHAARVEDVGWWLQVAGCFTSMGVCFWSIFLYCHWPLWQYFQRLAMIAGLWATAQHGGTLALICSPIFILCLHFCLFLPLVLLTLSTSVELISCVNFPLLEIPRMFQF